MLGRRIFVFSRKEKKKKSLIYLNLRMPSAPSSGAVNSGGLSPPSAQQFRMNILMQIKCIHRASPSTAQSFKKQQKKYLKTRKTEMISRSITSVGNFCTTGTTSNKFSTPRSAQQQQFPLVNTSNKVN